MSPAAFLTIGVMLGGLLALPLTSSCATVAAAAQGVVRAWPMVGCGTELAPSP